MSMINAYPGFGALPPVRLDARLKRPRLLVVDDQPVNIQALFQIFSPDCQVLMATSGEKALALCKEDQIGRAHV